jgi:hypothetical protein
VPVVGSAAASDDVQVGEALPQLGVAPRQVDGVAVVELLGLVEPIASSAYVTVTR